MDQTILLGAVAYDPKVVTIWEGIKEYSAWPTIPQLYVQGEFVGGCDIVTELFQTGELDGKLGASAPTPPNIRVTDAAQSALAEAVDAGEFVRLEVSPSFEHGLSVGSKQPGDLEVPAGKLTLLVDGASARRADGISIDCVETADGRAFKIENPNEPPRPKPLQPAELKQMFDRGEPLLLVDVRTVEEATVARIEPSQLLDQPLMEKLEGMDKTTTLVFYCHHGQRSQRAAEHFAGLGFSRTYNLIGGIDAWSREIDPDVARY